MNNSAMIEVSNDTAIESVSPLNTARNAMEALWNMLQDEQGQPLSLAANDLLLTVYNGYEQIAGRYDALTAEVDALMTATDEARQQRDAAIRQLDTVRNNGARAAINVILSNLHYDFGIDKDAAKVVLDIINGVDTGLPYYTITTLRRAFELVDEEVREQREQEAQDAAMGDPEDDYDPQ